MTLETLYQQVGGNICSITERLGDKTRIDKFLMLFLKDQSYNQFVDALEQGDIKEAFRGVHTLKGVCGNMSFDELYRVSCQVTEFLRAGDLISAMAAFPELEACYSNHIEKIESYLGTGERRECDE